MIALSTTLSLSLSVTTRGVEEFLELSATPQAHNKPRILVQVGAVSHFKPCEPCNKYSNRQ